ncbi:hypothetical protein CHS0354_007518 [Potamilus streckersoni]|uniref:BZIP domain-containing protein n=1 Tax=Potamilus streckersoni TaxID=2493646 RepID=A0AAE0T7Z6_9BIVA|nr:hypothetical protein CHS0354_007518 [Potamilus streckersoni]
MKDIQTNFEGIWPTSLEFNETDLIEIKDETVRQAALQYQQTGSLLPIVKMELKCKILQNRLSRGEGEIEIDFTSRESGQFQLSPEEIERINKRRESNRLSARKSRMKKKSAVGKLKKEVAELEAKNSSLRQELIHLRQEKSRLLTFYSSCYKQQIEFSNFSDTSISASVNSALRTIIGVDAESEFRMFLTTPA